MSSFIIIASTVVLLASLQSINGAGATVGGPADVSLFNPTDTTAMPASEGTFPHALKNEPGVAPVIITDPGAQFQDEARPGAMIIGMDRTPKGRIWGCWTGPGDTPDAYFILATSDDDGATWSKPRLVVGAPDASGTQRRALVGNLWTDPAGRLWMLARTQTTPFESYSSDQGVSWSAPTESAIKNGLPDQRLKPRSHLCAFLSDDDGKTWGGGLLLDERNSVSYPDGFQSPDGAIHVLYDWNRHTDAEILMARFRESDVMAARIVSPDAKLRMLANKAKGPRRVSPK